MKKFSLLALLISFIGYSQNFEGEISYSNSYKSKIAQVNDEQWKTMMGGIQKYAIKNGDYKSETNGTLMLWQLYINKDNKLYNKMSNSEVIYWFEGSVQNEEILSATINKNSTEVLGYTCDELILNCKSGVQKYYFNSKFSVDPSNFINHKFGNWYDFVSRSKAMPLKIIIDTNQFTLTSVATNIVAKALDMSMFSLPQGAQTAKSPY